MRLPLSILLLTIISCTQKHSVTGRITSCELGKHEGLDDYKKGILYINGQSVRYGQELEDLLNQRGIKYSTDPFGHVYECYDLVMDSLIKIKFGDDFVEKLKLVVDRWASYTGTHYQI